MEKLLRHIWQYRLFDARHLTTTDGQRLEIIHPGIPQEGSGTIFFNARIGLDGQTWAGNITVLSKSSLALAPDTPDDAYDTTLLLVVQEADVPILRSNKERVPQFVLPVSTELKERFDTLTTHTASLPCAGWLSIQDSLLLSDWMAALSAERLEQKTQRIQEWLSQEHGNWEEVCYRLLCRHLGFHTHSDAFERLARHTPLRLMQKHADSLFQVEAILFGQAGLLEDSSLTTDSYYQQLQREYLFLKQKFGLTPPPASCLKDGTRMRPMNSPCIRIAMLACCITQRDSLFARICDAESMQDFRELFKIELSGYWDTHYAFGKTSPSRKKTLGRTSAESLLINIAAPLLYAYGLHRRNDACKERALRLLEALAPEKNRSVSEFASAGIVPQNAFESQALLQLRNRYCNHRECLDCRIGHRILSQR